MTRSPMMKQPSGDSFNIIELEWTTARNNRMSEVHGRPIYDRILRVHITSPGAKNQAVCHELERHFWVPEGQEPHSKRSDRWHEYRQFIEAWEAENTQDLEGTPLQAIAQFDEPIIASLKEMRIHTVEALAGLADGNLFTGARKWREMARAYLQTAEDQAPLSDLIAKNEDLEAKVAELTKQIEDLTAPKSKRGSKAA